MRIDNFYYKPYVIYVVIYLYTLYILEEKIIVAFATLKLQSNTLGNVRRNLMRRAQLCMQQQSSNNF